VVLGVGGSSPLAHPIESAGQKICYEQSADLLLHRCPILGAEREPILVKPGLSKGHHAGDCSDRLHLYGRSGSAVKFAKEHIFADWIKRALIPVDRDLTSLTTRAAHVPQDQ
jgi:hypothetical protein